MTLRMRTRLRERRRRRRICLRVRRTSMRKAREKAMTTVKVSGKFERREKKYSHGFSNPPFGSFIELIIVFYFFR